MWDVRYRPLTFAEVLGQEGTVQVLRSRLENGTAHDTSYIFSGGHGQGKTTLARILARALLCLDLQEGSEPCNECDNCEGILSESTMAFQEMDAASKGTIDNVRGIVEDLPFVVQGARKRVYLFDEAHRMSRDAQDVLLKPIEDKQLIAILCTTEPEKIRGPIRSRCEEHSISKISREAIQERMVMVMEKEGVEFEPDAITTVIDYCSGHVRDVLNKLEMVSQLGPVTAAAVRERLNLSVISTYYEVLLALGDPAKAIELVERACDRVGPEEVASGLAEAAMSSYRLAHKMYTDFAFVDRSLAVKVHQTYGDDVVRLAEYFLSPRRASKIGLVCDVVRCVEGVPARTAQAVAPRIMVQAVPAPQPPAAPMELESPPEPSESPSEPPEDPEPASAPKSAETVATAPTDPAPPLDPAPPPLVLVPEPEKPKQAIEVGKVGPIGSELDHKAISATFPRRRDDDPHHRQSEFKGKHGGDENSGMIPSAQWAREFEAAWTQRGTGGV